MNVWLAQGVTAARRMIIIRRTASTLSCVRVPFTVHSGGFCASRGRCRTSKWTVLDRVTHMVHHGVTPPLVAGATL